MMNKLKTTEEIRKAVLNALHHIAPEVDLDELEADDLLREEMDIDSMDFLRFLQEVSVELKIDVPETDYDKLTTINNCVEYLDEQVNGKEA